MIDALDALRREVDDLVRGREEWLDTITVGRPAGVSDPEWVRRVQAMLEDLRVDGVELFVEPAAGPPWIRGSKFTDGWAP